MLYDGPELVVVSPTAWATRAEESQRRRPSTTRR